MGPQEAPPVLEGDPGPGLPQVPVWGSWLRVFSLADSVKCPPGEILPVHMPGSPQASGPLNRELEQRKGEAPDSRTKSLSPTHGPVRSRSSDDTWWEWER